MASSLIGNPQDVLTTPYGYSGQFSPETAVQEQALNRRRLITNMLMQQGLQQPQGQMVGRFYVPASPVQGLSHLLQAGLGAYLGTKIDDQQKELATSENDAKDKVINAYLEARKPKPLPTAQPPMPPAQGQAMLPQEPPSAPTEPFRGIAPRPEGPYSGEVGAVPMPGVGVQSGAPPIETQRPESIAGQTNLQGLDMGNAQPADMSQFAPPATDAQPLPPQPAPAPTPPPQMIEPSKEDRYAEIVKLLTHKNPAVARFGAMEYQRMNQEGEHAAQREFLGAQKAEDRDVRREGILENSRMREAQLQNTMALTQMQIDSRMQQGRDANDLKATLAQQSADLQKLQIDTMKELKKAEIGSRADTAKQHDETLKAVAGINVQGKKDVAGMKQAAGRPLPGSIGQKFIDNSSNLRQAERALALASGQEVEGVKGDPNATGMKGYLPDAILQRTDPSGVDTRAAIANLGSMVIHDRSGAAVTAAEFPRLRPFIPSANDDPPVVKKKLGQFVNEYRKIVDEMTDFYGESGYDVPKGFHKTPESTASAASGPATQRAVKRTGTHNGKKVIEYADGTIEYAN